MALPVDVKDVMKAGRKLVEERDALVHVLIVVDPAVPGALVDVVREGFSPQTIQGRIAVEILAEPLPRFEPPLDLVVVLSVGSDLTDDAFKMATRAGVPVVVLTAPGAPVRGIPAKSVLVIEDLDSALDDLGAWLVESAESIRMPLAANFTFMRKHVALESVRATAFQNAIVGGVLIIPGADMPVMTANQAKMLLQIAAAYGEPLGKERIKELAVVVGGGFAFRTVARQIIGLIPALGWAVKAAIGYSGTLAMGRAAVEYFEAGGDFSGLGSRVIAARDSIVERVRARKDERLLATPARRENAVQYLPTGTAETSSQAGSDLTIAAQPPKREDS